VLGIKISIEINLVNKSNIKIKKNNSGSSGEHKQSPENENLFLYFGSLSPVSSVISGGK
jgi:hypothetical protein